MSARSLIRYKLFRLPLFLLLVFLLGSMLFALPRTTFAAEVLPMGVLEQQTCGATVVDIYGYGAGLMHTTEPLTATDVRVSTVDAAAGCAAIEWNTQHPAATQVLYAPVSDEPVSIDLTAENFGYPHASVQNNAGIAEHTAILSGLEPGVTYSYRVVTRSHPNALPQISDARTFVAEAAAPIVPVVPTVPVVPATPVTPQPQETETSQVTEPVASVETTPESPAVTETESPTVPSAITAAQRAFDGTRESAFFSALTTFFAGLMPDSERLSLASTIGLFKADTYIIPTLFFLVLLFLLQQLVLPAFNVELRNPLLYWLFGSMVLAILSAVFMFYYVSLVAIAVFLGALARYLLQYTPADAADSKEPKLLETAEQKAEHTSTKATTSK